MYSIEVDYSQSLETMIRKSNPHTVNRAINSQCFKTFKDPVFKPNAKVASNAVLLTFDQDIPHYKAVVEEIEAANLRPGTLAEMLSLTAKYSSDLDFSKPLVALGTTLIMVSAGLIVPAAKYRELMLMGNQFPWKRNKFTFLAIEK